MSRRSRQRQNARPWSAGEVIEYDEHDPTPWPLPDMSSDGREIDTSGGCVDSVDDEQPDASA